MEGEFIIGYKKPNNYIIDEIDKTVKIELRRRNKESLWTIIDLEDMEKVLNYPYSWHSIYKKDTDGFYAEASKYIVSSNGAVLNEHVYLHKFLLNPDNDPTIQVDHVYHNTLDNRKSNLRTITIDNNLKNRKGKNSNNVSGYRNVAYIKSIKKKPYHVQLMVNGKNTVLGKFSDVGEAGAFAEEMRKKYYGKYAGES